MTAPDELSKCELCGEPMPPGETMFKFHGYSGDCPKPPLPKPDSAPNGLADGDVRALLARVVRTIDNWDGPMVHPFAKLVTPAVRDWLRNQQPGGAVPREPTDAMLAVGVDAVTRLFRYADPALIVKELWIRMHDAATKAGAGDGNGDG